MREAIRHTLTAFGRMIGRRRSITPYSDHNAVPVPITTSIRYDRSRQERERKECHTCGRKDAVVSVPAT